MKFRYLFVIIFLLLPLAVFAQDNNEQTVEEGENFEAKIVEVLDQKEITRENGSKAIQQNLKLKALTGRLKGKEVIFQGISDLEVISAGIYKKGDKVVVNHIKNADGLDEFYVMDYVRRGYLYLLAGIFGAVIVLIGRWKGIKALLGLIVSFFIIMKYIVPQILAGGNPLTVSLIGSFTILATLIYFTEGWGKKSHIAMVSIFFSLVLTLILSIIFTKVARLSGLAQEEALFLIGMSKVAIDFRGLLLAGILVGTLGVLDDGVVSQIEAVEQIKEANPKLSKSQIFKSAFVVGNTHLGAIVNTLFLTYAGASLPLLLLFTLNQSSSFGYDSILNNQAIATEIVRTLVGSIGVAMSLPIATFLASYYIGRKKCLKNEAE